MSDKIKAVGMLSGGLDSTLAAHIMKQMGVEIQGVNFSTGFCITDHHRKINRDDEPVQKMQNEALRLGADLKIPLEIIDISGEYWDILLNPKHGYPGDRCGRVVWRLGACQSSRVAGGD